MRLGIGAQVLALEIAQLVMRLEIGGLQLRPAFEPDDFHAGFAEFGRENAAGGADADDHNIGFLGCHGFSPSCGLGCDCRPTMGSRVKASLLCMSSGV